MPGGDSDLVLPSPRAGPSPSSVGREGRPGEGAVCAVVPRAVERAPLCAEGPGRHGGGGVEGADTCDHQSTESKVRK